MTSQHNPPLTLGSLFDGISGFPLAGTYAGMQPIWASEIDPFPIRVATARFPNMKHYGDIRTLHGGALEPVDVITFGSPCTDLSIAGARAGITGKQSSLFFEAVRIIQEMRKATHDKYPRFAVFENVYGCLSSQKGADFRQILESFIRLKDPTADVPMPETGKWLSAGEIVGDDYAIAWRVLDAAKGWGVAQRRRRLFVVIDLDGACAGKVLFESEGLSGYSPPSAAAGQGTAGGLAAGAGEASGGGVAPAGIRAYGIGSAHSEGMLSANPHAGIYEATTSRTLDRSGGDPACNQGGIAVLEPIAFAQNQRDEVRDLQNLSGALAASPGMKQQTFVAAFLGRQGAKACGLGYREEQSPTLKATQSAPDVVYALQGSMIGRKGENGPQGCGVAKEVCFTIDTTDCPAVAAPSYCMTVGGFA